MTVDQFVNGLQGFLEDESQCGLSPSTEQFDGWHFEWKVDDDQLIVRIAIPVKEFEDYADESVV